MPAPYNPYDMGAFDTETHLIQPGLLTPPLVCGSFAGPTEESGWITNPAQTRQTLARILTLKKTIAGANIAYDFAVMCAYDPSLLDAVFQAYEEKRVYDIQIAQALDAIAGGHLGKHPNGGPLRNAKGKITERYSLDVCVRLVLGRDDAKVHDFWRTRYALLEDKPLSEWPAEALQYPRDDAANTLAVALRQLETHRNLHDLPHQVRYAWAAHLGAVWGLRTDRERVTRLRDWANSACAERDMRFKKLGFIREDGSKNKKIIQERVSLAYEGNPPKTDKGAVKTDRDTLLESGDDILIEWADNEVEKIHDTYLPFLEQGLDRPINLRPNPLVASGRTSYDGLIQLMPRGHGVRDCFKARPGYVYCSCDYSGIELATLAQSALYIVGHSHMADVLNEGKDLHSAFAAQMVGLDYDVFMTRLTAGDKQLKAYRQAAKAANFGFPGGMGAPKLVLAKRKEKLKFCRMLKDEECTERVRVFKGRDIEPVCRNCLQIAASLRDEWFKQWPEMWDYFEHAKAIAESTGSIEQFKSCRVRGGLDFCNAANGYFQGLAADGGKHAFWLVSKECYTDQKSPLYGSRPIMFIHDEIFAEVPEQLAHLAGPRMAKIMIDAMREYAPDVRVSVEPALMRFWDKSAEPVYRDGKLIPWEDR